MCILCGRPLVVHDHNDPLYAPSGEGADGPAAFNQAPPAPGIVETADAAANTSTAYTLAIGQTAQGQLGTASDHDWYKVSLVAGQTYTFAMTGTGTNNVTDTYLQLYASNGTTVVDFDDDSLPGSNSIFTYTASTSGTYYIDAASWNSSSAGQYGISVTAGTKASFDALMGAGVIDTDLSWSSTPGTGATVTYGFRQSITYDPGGPFSQFSTAEMAAVQKILQLWSDVCNITFVQQNPGGYTNSASILFGNYTANDGAGAYAYYPGSTASSSSAGDVWANTNSVSTTSLPFGSYSFEALMHEIGHAIGLSHPGLYNAALGVSITYSANASFVQDTQQYSVMSYFDESSTGGNDAGYPQTPLLFDIYAVQQIYGANYSTRAGDTVYGFGSTAGSVYDFSGGALHGLSIWDGGGIDTLNCSGFSQAETINLTPGVFSSIGGLVANVSIALGATIEIAIGGSGNDIITGNSADNTLRGGLGNDTIDGGAGTDSAVFTGARSLYTVNNLGGGSATVTGPDGSDTLYNMEKLVFDDQTITLGGGAVSVADLIATGLAMNASSLSYQIRNTGSAAANSSSTGIYLSTDSTISTADTLLAVVSTPSLAAGANDNEALSVSFPGNLTAGTYYLGAVADYNGLINETDESNNASIGFAVILGNNSVNTLIGTSGNDTLFGLGGNDTLDGSVGTDNMTGGTGDDTYFVDNAADQVFENVGEGWDILRASVSYTLAAGQAIEALTTTNHSGTAAINLTGNEFSQYIQGNAGDNLIDGDGGADTMLGGYGNDQFFIDNAGDVATEFVGEGYDIARAGVSYTLAAGSEVEALTTNNHSGTAAINLTGNEFAQFIEGNAGNNLIDGGGGADTMLGGAGNDQFFIDNAGDAATEFVGEGFDIVRAGVSYTLAAGSEIEALTTTNHSGTAAIKLTGNEFAQFIEGNAGNNLIDGGAGNDTLVGGGGADVFFFNSPLNPSTNVDIIVDYTVGTNQIQLENSFFTGLATGVLAAGAFAHGTTATDADDRILYDDTTGRLFFDPDGVGGAGATQFATLSAGLALSNLDFFVV